MEDIFETSIVQQCRMLEANLNTSVLAECLTHPECAPDIVKRSKVNIINSDFKLLLTSAIEKCGSAAPAACIATQTSWRRLWDVALEKGIKGTRIMQMLFKELCRPMSCFKCSKCDPEVLSDSSCLEHICNNHPNEIRNLSYDHLISKQTLKLFFLHVNSCLTVTPFGLLSIVKSIFSVSFVCICPLGYCQ